jgi:hypothetical protein
MRRNFTSIKARSTNDSIGEDAVTQYGEHLRSHLAVASLLAAEVQELSALAERNGFFDLANKLESAALEARQLKVTMKWRRTTESIQGITVDAARTSRL